MNFERAAKREDRRNDLAERGRATVLSVLLPYKKCHVAFTNQFVTCQEPVNFGKSTYIVEVRKPATEEKIIK
jgi:hypothetical protein